MEAQLIGRNAPVAALESWLADPWARVAIVEGEAGIGKTTVWQHACSHARRQGYAVVSCSPAEAERHLVFAGLTDLLTPLLAESAATLAPARRQAIEAALLLAESMAQPPEEHAVAFAALDILRLAGRRQSLVLAIDDVQWLDRSSALVLAFALRRLVDDDRVALLVARRAADDDSGSLVIGAIEPERRTGVPLGPFSLGAIHHLYRQRLGLSLPRPRIVRIHEICGGNPLFALEIGRALAANPTPALGELPIPPSLGDAIGARLTNLPPTARRVALLAAAAAEPTVAVLSAASRDGDCADAIAKTVAAGIFVADGETIRFQHPLLASAAYAYGTDADRRDAHSALAVVVAAPEERARHLALAKGGPDAIAAAALDEAADRAEARGAHAVSGEFRTWAAEMTPAADVDARDRRLVGAGQATFKSGDIERARELLERVALAPGPWQHEALWRLGILLDETTGWNAAREHWLAALATEDLELRVNVERSIAITTLYVESVDAASSSSARAVEAAERLGDSRVLAYALATDALVRTVGGDPRAAEVLAAAAALDPHGDLPELEWSPHGVAADCARIALSLDDSRTGFACIHELAVARGDFQAELWSAYGSGQVAIDAGALTVAQAVCAEVNELTQQSGLMTLPALRLGARLAAHRGDAQTCRALTGQCIAAARSRGERIDELQALTVLGTLELSEGDVEAATRTLDAAHAIATESRIGAPGILRFVVDQSEALAGVGRLDEADSVLETFERRADELGYGWARPLLDRCRGLSAAARGDAKGGVRLLRAAYDARGLLPLPLERARIELCLGRVLRRSKQRSEARTALEAALVGFESLEARLWSNQAEAELARIGGRRSSGGELTPSERRIAELVAQGKTNREVGDALFVTVHTVEAALTRVYGKLGIRSRTELANCISTPDLELQDLTLPDLKL